MKSSILKKLIITASVLAIVTGFVGCGTGDTNKKKADTDKPQVEESVAPKDNVDKEQAKEDKSIESVSIKETSVHFIDTGNSDAILIKGEKSVLIDGGDNNDEEMIVEYLKKEGIKKLDYMVATHNHADHIGGLDEVLNDMEVGHVFVSNGDGDSQTYRDFITAIAGKKVEHGVPLDGAKIELGNGAYMQMYNTNGGSNTNDESLITLYVNGNDKFLFTGDAEKGAELEVLSKLVDVDVLKVGHHGSKTSTTNEFLEKVNPEIAVITVGQDNKYNHPDKEVMDKLKADDITVYRTDENGTIIIKSTGDGVKTDSKEGSYNHGDDGFKTVKPGTVDKADTEKPKEEEVIKPEVEIKPEIDKLPEEESIKPEKPPVEEENSNSGSESVGKMVWKSATGKKYHSINDCGRMNPDNAVEITIEAAQSGGLEDCSKC